MAQITLDEEYRKIAGAQSVLGDPSGKPAYLYGRSSDPIQTEDGRESMGRQLLFADEKGKKFGYYVPLDMVYYDVWTGKDAERPEFHRLLSDAKDNKPSDVVLIDTTDRLSRNKAVYYVLTYDLTRYGLTPVFEQEEDDLVRHMKIAFDELELEKRRYRQIQANKSRARKGHITNRYAAFGYDLTKDKKQYKINEDEALWVKRMYEWYARGKSLRWITDKLYELGVKTPRGKDRWYPSAVQRVLRNENYKGLYIANRDVKKQVWEGGKKKWKDSTKPEDEWIKVEIPAIVTEDLWDEVQVLLTDNRDSPPRSGGRKYEWLLTGILTCANCGSKMISKHHVSRSTHKGKTRVYEYDYYGCGSHSNMGFKCDRKYIRKEELEPHVLSALDQLFLNPEHWIEALDNQESETDRWQSHLEFHKSQIAELEKQYAELVQMAIEKRSTTAKKVFEEKQKQIEESIASHREQLSIARDRLTNAQTKSSQYDLVMDVLDWTKEIGGISGLGFEEKREIVLALIDEILVDTKEEWFQVEGVLTGKYTFEGDEILSSTLRSATLR